MNNRPPQDVLDRIAGKSMLEIQAKVHGLIQDAYIELRERTGVALYDEALADEAIMAVECLCWAAHLVGYEEGKKEKEGSDG